MQSGSSPAKTAPHLSLVVGLPLAVHRPDGVLPHGGSNVQQLRSAVALQLAATTLQLDRQRHLHCLIWLAERVPILESTNILARRW